MLTNFPEKFTQKPIWVVVKFAYNCIEDRTENSIQIVTECLSAFFDENMAKEFRDKCEANDSTPGVYYDVEKSNIYEFFNGI